MCEEYIIDCALSKFMCNKEWLKGIWLFLYWQHFASIKTNKPADCHLVCVSFSNNFINSGKLDYTKSYFCCKHTF